MLFEIFLNLVAIVLLILPILDWIATYILHQVAKKAGPSQIAIKERATVALVLAVVTTINAALAVNRLAVDIIPDGIPLVLLSISLILVSMPNIYWLWLYHKKRLH